MSKLWKSKTLPTIITSLGMSLSFVARGASAETTLELGAYLDRPGGREIVEQRYYDAIDLTETWLSKPRPAHRLVAYTNLCVAHVKVGNLESAKEMCDQAVDLAKARDGYGASRTLRESAPAVVRALNNRGVVSYLLGDPGAAIEDLETAAELRDRTDGWVAPKRNLAYVESRETGSPAVAQTSE